MHTYRRRVGVDGRFTGALAAVLLFLVLDPFGVTPALAGVGASASPGVPATSKLGQMNRAGSITLKNANNAGNVDDADTVDGVHLTMGCGSAPSSDLCPAGREDTGVFFVLSATGRAGTSCAGLGFNVSVSDATSEQLLLTPLGALTLPAHPLDADPTTFCVIDFTYNVCADAACSTSHLPTKDLVPTRNGIQTAVLVGTVGLVDAETGEGGGGVGSASTSFPVLTTSQTPTTGTRLVTLLTDSATLVGTSVTGLTNTATGTVTFNLYDPTQTGCVGTPRHTFTRTITAGNTQADCPWTLAAGFACQDTAGFLPDMAGTWQWVAVYSGDALNVGVDSACGAEPVEISQPSLAITKTPDGTQYNLGDTVSFTIVVTNNGPGTAVNVKIPADTLPDPNASLNWGLASLSCSGQSGGAPSCTVTGPAGSQQLACSFFNLDVSGNCTVTVSTPTQTTEPNDCPPALNNTAQAVADNAGTVSDDASQICQKPHLALVKTPDNFVYNLGDTVSFTIVLTNDGPGLAHNVRLSPSDTLPDPHASLNWVLASVSCTGQSDGAPACSVTGAAGAQTLNCSFFTLAPNGNCTVTVSSPTQTTDANDCIPTPGLVNNATVVDDEGDSASDGANQLCNRPSLLINKTPDGTQYNAGDTINFTIVVTNQGPGTAVNVRFDPADALPDPGSSLDWSVTTQPAQGSCSVSGAPGSQVLNCSFGDMTEGQSLTVIVSSPTQANDPRDCGNPLTLNNLARVVADNADPKQDPGSQSCTSRKIVPTLSEWGMLVFVVLLVGFGSLALSRRRRLTA